MKRDELLRWVLMALPLALALGLFAAASAWRLATIVDEEAELELDYARLDRFAEPTMLRVRVPRGAGKEKTLKLRLNRSYVNGVRIKSIEPRPKEMREEEDAWVFVFAIDKPGEAQTVTFQVEGIAYGQLDGQFAIAGKKGLGFRQYLLP